MFSLFAIAVIPALIILWFIYYKDPVEKEPVKLLGSLFGFGALSAILAVIFELIADQGLGAMMSTNSLIYLFLENFIGVALIEELCKYFFLYKRAWKNPEFNYLFDGIVYAVFVSLGFAVLENLLYVFEFGFETGIGRAFTSLPGHTVFAVFMGYFFAHAKIESIKGNESEARKNLTLAIVAPTVAHGSYDFVASLDGDWSIILFLVLITAMFLGGLKVINDEAKAAVKLYSSTPFESHNGSGTTFAGEHQPGSGRPDAGGPAPAGGFQPGAVPPSAGGAAPAGERFPSQTQPGAANPAPVSHQCANCRSWLLPGAKFCQNCGTKVE